MAPEAHCVERFRVGLDALIAPSEKIGIAVSGGPDSLALLLLAAAARPGLIEAATVDHRLRAESTAEAKTVARICDKLGVPHTTLPIEWREPPGTAIQERARAARYEAMGGWLRERDLRALLTAHHLDDQAETLMMRLNRGAGVQGLAAMRPISRVPGTDISLLHPLLNWRRSELERVCAAASLQPVSDPSNEDPQFERVRIRLALAENDWLEPAALARSAANLATADEALEWATDREWHLSVKCGKDGVTYHISDAPSEIRRRIVARIIAILAREGQGDVLRGREIDRLLEALERGETATLRGVKCRGGSEWRFKIAPPRQ